MARHIPPQEAKPELQESKPIEPKESKEPKDAGANLLICSFNPASTCWKFETNSVKLAALGTVSEFARIQLKDDERCR